MPGEVLFESDVFGIRLPGSGPDVFVSVMGANKEVYALAFYLGVSAMHAFSQLQDPENNFHPSTLLSIPHILLSWDDKNALDPLQAAILKQCNRSYRGKQVWPVFSRIEPGYVPHTPPIKEFIKLGKRPAGVEFSDLDFVVTMQLLEGQCNTRITHSNNLVELNTAFSTLIDSFLKGP